MPLAVFTLLPKMGVDDRFLGVVSPPTAVDADAEIGVATPIKPLLLAAIRWGDVLSLGGSMALWFIPEPV